MTRTRLTSAEIGAWLLKCNPAMWNIDHALAAGQLVDTWRLFPSYRVGLVQPNQPVVLWVTGPGRRSAPISGIHMAGYTTGTIVPDARGDEYWLDEAERRKRRPYIGLRMRLVTVLPRERLVDDPRTARLEVLRVPQGSNPSYLSRAETAAVEEMMGGWPEPV